MTEPDAKPVLEKWRFLRECAEAAKTLDGPGIDPYAVLELLAQLASEIARREAAERLAVEVNSRTRYNGDIYGNGYYDVSARDWASLLRALAQEKPT